MITLDGSVGEGGGQVVRTALSLALATCQPFRICNIRAKRKKPGLLDQHLTAVRAAAAIGTAEVEGAGKGALSLSFAPAGLQAGFYHFDIGTAGSCILVLQAILPALIAAGGASTVVLEGGTHNPFAPTFDFLYRTFLPLLNRMGMRVKATLEWPGFYPRGGGRIRVAIEPAAGSVPLQLTECSNLSFATSIRCAGLPEHIALRELEVIREKLEIAESATEMTCTSDHGPGNVVSVFAESDQLTETFTGHGKKGRRAEAVATEVAAEALAYRAAGVPVGRYLADQLLVPLVLTGGGTFLTGKPSSHTLTNAAVIRQFCGDVVQLEQEGATVWRVTVKRADRPVEAF